MRVDRQHVFAVPQPQGQPLRTYGLRRAAAYVGVPTRAVVGVRGGGEPLLIVAETPSPRKRAGL